MKNKVDMSAQAVTTRLKRVAQLRRLGLSLQKAELLQRESATPAKQANQSDRQKGE